MHLPPFLLATIGLGGVITGRLLFGRWFNHLSLYSLIWGTGLAFFELRWINYKPLTVEAWLLIGYAWIAFAAGSATLPLGRVAIRAHSGTAVTAFSMQATRAERRLLVTSFLVLSTLALVGVLQHWAVLINKFGSIAGVLISGNLIYRLRTAEQLPGMIPYLDSVALAATFLAGLYTARGGKIKAIALIPLIVVIVGDIALVGRAKMLNAGILFFSAYFLTKIASRQAKSFAPVGKGKRLLTLGLVLAIFLIAAEFVRSYRGTFEHFYGMSRELSKLERNVFVTPSLYMYLSSHPGVFNAYWKAGGENPFPGSNTFAPLFRILSRFGLAEDVPDYQRFYLIPFSSNTGTYLRELHADFGLAGILVVPYVLGLGCSILWFKIMSQPRLTAIAWLSHLYVIVAFSYLYQATRAGYWFISLVTSLLVSSFIDYWCHHPTVREKQNAD